MSGHIHFSFLPFQPFVHSQFCSFELFVQEETATEKYCLTKSQYFFQEEKFVENLVIVVGGSTSKCRRPTYLGYISNINKSMALLSYSLSLSI